MLKLSYPPYPKEDLNLKAILPPLSQGGLLKNLKTKLPPLSEGG
jgi:hypothetical protein